MKKDRLNVYCDPTLATELKSLAARWKVSKSAVIEAALASYLSPDGDDQREAAQAKCRQRYDGFVEALGRRLAKGSTLAKEVSEEVESLSLS